MKKSLKLALLSSSILGLAMLAAPSAQARYHGWDDRNRSIATSPETGGYCDNAGCPDHFWRYPIHYGPVFVHGQWFRGPVYFQGDRYGRRYWVRGGWHRDEWRGHRPWWARQAHDGPPQGFEFYADHGFQLGDHWRQEHDADSGGDNGWNGRDHHDNGGDHGGGWPGADNTDHHDHGGNWQGGDNGGHQGNGYNGGDNANRDWHGNGNGSANGDQGRPWDNNGRNNSGSPNGQRAGYGGNGQGQPSTANSIHVTGATYGATCHVPSGNVTKFLADACNGRAMCEYVVQYQTIGDPAPGCAKDFSVQWTCSAGPGGNAAAPAEAGLGSKVTLQCANTGH